MLVKGSLRPNIAVRIGERLRLLLINATTAETFWVDSTLVGEEIERIAFVAGNPGKWLIESRAICAAKRRPAAGLGYRPAASCANSRW